MPKMYSCIMFQNLIYGIFPCKNKMIVVKMSRFLCLKTTYTFKLFANKYINQKASQTLGRLRYHTELVRAAGKQMFAQSRPGTGVCYCHTCHRLCHEMFPVEKI